LKLNEVEKTRSNRGYSLVAIGGSAGSTHILKDILSRMPDDFGVPILIVQHLHESDKGLLAENLAFTSNLPVIAPLDKCPIFKAKAYVAPAGYHMLVEKDMTIALSVDEKVNHSRPSIDVLFESAAHAFGEGLVAVILSGASQDGASGMKIVKQCGGTTIVQSPESSEFRCMPESAIKAISPDYVQSSSDIPVTLIKIVMGSDRNESYGKPENSHCR
jgi:two-component system chemotaxis response regulator CheB